ncbi:MAG: hypothetical protein AAB631_00885 [Patescibacteria group bacterium]
MGKIAAITIGMILIGTGFTYAQTPPNLFAEILPPGNAKINDINFQTIIPQPIKDFANKARGTQIDLNQFPKLKAAIQSVKGAVGNPAEILRDSGSWWQRINDWMRSKIGFDLRQIVKAIGSLFLYVIDIVKEIVVWAIAKL